MIPSKYAMASGGPSIAVNARHASQQAPIVKQIPMVALHR
jgi:hypothetical protein